MKAFGAGVAVALLLAANVAVHANPFVLDGKDCTGGNAINGMTLGGVTGDEDTTLGDSDGAANPATECWGTFDGNDPKNDGLQVGDMVFDFISRNNLDGTIDGDDIGLEVNRDFDNVNEGFLNTGEWAITGAFDPDPAAFLVVLKAANNPGFGVWLFDGESGDVRSGDYTVQWGDPKPALSHLSIYVKRDTPPPPPPPSGVPEPGTLGFLGVGIAAIGYARRRKKSRRVG